MDVHLICEEVLSNEFLSKFLEPNKDFQTRGFVQSESLASFVSRFKALHASVPESTQPDDSDAGRQGARRIH